MDTDNYPEDPLASDFDISSKKRPRESLDIPPGDTTPSGVVSSVKPPRKKKRDKSDKKGKGRAVLGDEGGSVSSPSLTPAVVRSPRLPSTTLAEFKSTLCSLGLSAYFHFLFSHY